MQHDDAAGLRPVHGSPSSVYDLVTTWLDSDDPPPLTVRTSGSTGRSKDVLLSRTAIRASADATLRRLGGSGQWIVALPVNYVAGLQVITRSAVAGVRPIALAEHGRLLEASHALTANRTYLACVPTQLYRWLGDSSARQALRRFDAVLVGGAALGAELTRRAGDAEVAIVTSYGMTETCGGCVYDGIPLDGVSVAVGTDSEVRIAGPVLFDGYLDGPSETAAVLRDGWYETGDLGVLDDDGRLVVTGRADDVVVSGGVNVSLSAVEGRLRQLPGLDAVCVIGQPDPQWGTRVVAYVVPEHRDGPDLDAVRDFVAMTLPRAWAPRQLVVVDTIPQLESGKPDREALRLLPVPAGGDDVHAGT